MFGSAFVSNYCSVALLVSCVSPFSGRKTWGMFFSCTSILVVIHLPKMLTFVTSLIFWTLSPCFLVFFWKSIMAVFLLQIEYHSGSGEEGIGTVGLLAMPLLMFIIHNFIHSFIQSTKLCTSVCLIRWLESQPSALPTELRCTLVSYTEPYWATLHPTELRCTL